MREFTSNDWFYIRGRGVMFGIAERWDGSGPEEWSPRCLTGQEVKIDGRRVTVKAVEMFMIYANEDQPYRLTFGLLL